MHTLATFLPANWVLLAAGDQAMWSKISKFDMQVLVGQRNATIYLGEHFKQR